MALRQMAVGLALLPLLGGCLVISSSGTSETVSVKSSDNLKVETEVLESLKSVRFDGQKMTAVVSSNGCTQLSQFEVRIVDTSPKEVSLVRREPDLCRAIVAEGVALSWTYEELGLKAGDSVKVLNPLDA